MGGPTVGCKVVRAAILVARSAGLDAPALLARHGVDPAALADPDARFPNDLWLGLWQEIDATGPGNFGLQAALALPEGHFDVVDYVMAASPDFGAALARFEKYFALMSTGVTHRVVEDGAAVRLERHRAPGGHTTIRHPTEFAFACVVVRSRIMTGVALRPVEIRFTHPRPADDREHRETFDCPVIFGASLDAIVFDRASMSLPMRRPQPELRRILEQHADAVLAAIPKTASDVRTQTKEAIVAGLEQGHSTLGEIAKRLGMSERTLQRRLGDAGTSHAELLDEARSQLAVRYLGEPAIAIQEVAFLLGFADPSTFHRAFRRWTGSTPAEHRRRARPPAVA